MRVSYQWLKDYLPHLPPPARTAELLTLKSFSVERQERLGSDTVLDVEIFPNRPDALSHEGIARELAVITGSELTLSHPPALTAPKLSPRQLALTISAKSAVPRYSALLVEGITIAPSPSWMQERLAAVGVRPVNNVVDITNYIMLECGQPLHAFDYEKIEGRVFKIREAKEGEKLITLDETERILPKGAIVVEDKKGLMDLAGIMGGMRSGVASDTYTILLHAIALDGSRIRAVERALGMRTEASLRYAYGVDPEGTWRALERAGGLLMELCGKDVRVKAKIDLYPKPAPAHAIPFSAERASSLLGVAVTAEYAGEVLTRLGCRIESRKGAMHVHPPSYRPDLVLEEDLIEEVGRIYGYDKIPAAFPEAALIPPARNDRLWWEDMVRDILVGAGFTELMQYVFTGKSQTEAHYPRASLLALKNPVSDEKYYLRPTLIFGVLQVIAQHIHTAKHLAVFEIGNVFHRGQEKTVHGAVEESPRCVFALAHTGGGREGDEFYEARGVLDMLTGKLGIADFYLREFGAVSSRSSAKAAGAHTTPRTLWHPSRSAEIHVGETVVGCIGEIHPALLAQYKIPFRVAVGDLGLHELFQFSVEDLRYKVYSKYPSAIRDVSVLVPPRTKAEDVLNIIEHTGGEHVRDVDLFDLYAGPELPEGRKSFAFHIVYQSDERTLMDAEVDESFRKVISALENCGWEVRKG